jgi:hypothetical protein
MIEFFKKHIVGGIGIVLGSAVTIGSLVLHAYELHEMGLPIEIWVAIGLGIFILSVVGILYKWWDENQRVPAGHRQVAQPEIGVTTRDVSSSSSPEKALAPCDIYHFHDPAPERNYPDKLCISLKNESDADLLVSPAKWENLNPSDIEFRRIQEHPWIPEGPKGWAKRDWLWSKSPGSAPIHVPRGRAIQTWVGLHGPLDDAELRQRIVGKRLGTLIIPLTANGESKMETHKL